MKSRNSFRYNGLIHKRTVGIETTKDNKGLVLTTRNPRGRCEEPVVRVTCVLELQITVLCLLNNSVLVRLVWNSFSLFKILDLAGTT